MLRDEIALYTKLSGNDGEHTPIGIIGAYLDGYDKGREERPQGEWHGNNFDEHSCSLCGHPALYEEEPDGYYEVQSNFCPNCGADMRGKDNG